MAKSFALRTMQSLIASSEDTASDIDPAIFLEAMAQAIEHAEEEYGIGDAAVGEAAERTVWEMFCRCSPVT